MIFVEEMSEEAVAVLTVEIQTLDRDGFCGRNVGRVADSGIYRPDPRHSAYVKIPAPSAPFCA